MPFIDEYKEFRGLGKQQSSPWLALIDYRPTWAHWNYGIGAAQLHNGMLTGPYGLPVPEVSLFIKMDTKGPRGISKFQ